MLLVGTAGAHDIPDARVDRSIQIIVEPGRLRVAYEVSLSELTLVRDLRRLLEVVPGEIDREALYRLYGEGTAALNARGFVVTVNGEERALTAESFELVIEEHPRFTFHFVARLPESGKLVVRDANYVSSDGTSRLAVQGKGAWVKGYTGPESVFDVPVRPVWQLGPDEERRTREAAIEFGRIASEPKAVPPAPVPAPSSRAVASNAASRPANRLTELLDGAGVVSWAGLLGVAFLLGAAHAIQPGHGKTLVAAMSLGERRSRGVVLALVTTLTHCGIVLALAALLWATRTIRYQAIHSHLAQAAGFGIAAYGLWRLGRAIGGNIRHDHGQTQPGGERSSGWAGLIGVGIGGGLVPCWDAVALIVVAEALGRLRTGIMVLLAFSAGMGAVLVVVGLAATRARTWLGPRFDRWERGLVALSGLVLAGIGLAMLKG